MRSVTRISVCAFVLALSPAMVACGSSGTVTVTGPSSGASSVPSSDAGASVDATAPVPDATSLAHDARSAYRAATSAHLHASIDDNGVTETIDIRGTMDGSNQELSIKDPGSGNATLRTVDDKYYIKGNQDFWESAAKSDTTTAALLADKWVLAPHRMATDNSIGKLTIRAFLDEMLGESALSDSELGDMTTSRGSQGGAPVFVAQGKDSHADTNTFKVFADGKNNVAEVSGASDDGSDGKATFDGWNTQARVDVPKGYVTFPDPGSGSGPDRTTGPTT